MTDTFTWYRAPCGGRPLQAICLGQRDEGGFDGDGFAMHRIDWAGPGIGRTTRNARFGAAVAARRRHGRSRPPAISLLQTMYDDEQSSLRSARAEPVAACAARLAARRPPCAPSRARRNASSRCTGAGCLPPAVPQLRAAGAQAGLPDCSNLQFFCEPLAGHMGFLSLRRVYKCRGDSLVN